MNRQIAQLSILALAMIAALILAPLMLGVSELGYRTWAKHQFEDAAQAGMDYAVVKGCVSATSCGFNATGMQSAVQNATSLGTKVTVAPASGCGANYYCYGCPGGSGVTLSATSGNCANGGAGPAAGNCTGREGPADGHGGRRPGTG